MTYNYNMMKESVKIYDDANKEVRIRKLDLDVYRNRDMQVKVISCGTVNAAYHYSTATNIVAMLDFADAKKPGGWPEHGAPTQEENMCRTTNLYEALILDKCRKRYYNKNNKYHTDDHIDEAYTDTIIYVKNATIFRDDVTYEGVNPKYADIIVCPAPCGNVKHVESVFISRMKALVKTAYENGATDLILGAWGCGAFGQNPKVVASCFAKVLKEYPLFKSVIFAFKPTIDDAEHKDNTKAIFKEILSKQFNVIEEEI